MCGISCVGKGNDGSRVGVRREVHPAPRRREQSVAEGLPREAAKLGVGQPACFNLMSPNPINSFHLRTHETTHRIGVGKGKSSSHDEYRGCKSAAGPKAPFVDAQMGASLELKPRSPRFGNPRCIDLTMSKSRQNIGVDHGQYCYAAS